MIVTILSKSDKILHSFTLSDEVIESLEAACKLNGTETVPALLENVVFDIYKSMLLQSVNEKVEAAKKAASKG